MAAASADRRVLCDILLRGQPGFYSSFLKAMRSINIPGALMVMSLIRLAIGVVPGRGTDLMFMRLATDVPLRGCPSAHDGQKPFY